MVYKMFSKNGLVQTLKTEVINKYVKYNLKLINEQLKANKICLNVRENHFME